MKKYALLTFLLALEASSISATQEHKWDEKNLGSIADIESFDSHETDSTSSNTNPKHWKKIKFGCASRICGRNSQ